jgi:hypothetical protein
MLSHIDGKSAQFDRSMTLALQKSVKAKSSIKVCPFTGLWLPMSKRQQLISPLYGLWRGQGHLKTYRSVDEVWNFSIQQPNLKLDRLQGAQHMNTAGISPGAQSNQTSPARSL